MYPSFWPVPLAGCAHWIREPGTASCLSIPPLLPPGTDNSINFQYKSGLTGPYVEVQRYRPQDPFHDPQVWTVAGLTGQAYGLGGGGGGGGGGCDGGGGGGDDDGSGCGGVGCCGGVGDGATGDYCSWLGCGHV